MTGRGKSSRSQDTTLIEMNRESVPCSLNERNTLRLDPVRSGFRRARDEPVAQLRHGERDRLKRELDELTWVNSFPSRAP